MFRKPIYNEDVTNNFMSRIPLKPVSFPAISMSRFPLKYVSNPTTFMSGFPLSACLVSQCFSVSNPVWKLLRFPV